MFRTQLYKIIAKNMSMKTLNTKVFYYVADKPCQLGQFLEVLATKGFNWVTVHNVGVEWKDAPNIFEEVND